MAPTDQTTVLFCRSLDDGTISPDWDEARDADLQGQFETGVTVAERYLLKENLGDGAMGRVFLAQDLRLDRAVAIKVVCHRRRADLEAALYREAKLGANLNHTGIAAVYDFGFHDNKSYTVFEYVEGETLRRVLNRRQQIPLSETLQVAEDLATAIDFAHSRGVVHRDLKPENICFTKQGEFKILDFGVAFDFKRDVETRTYSGTPAYSSPEQAECRLTDGKSDQYALALILFEMLTGQKAFIDSEPLRLLRRQVEEAPPSPRQLVPDLPERAERALLRALSKLPEDRYPTCQQLVHEMGAELARPSAAQHVVSIPAERRLGFYIGHVAEESLLARTIAEELERKRYSCWYYGRDAIPGVPFAGQSNSAMERSQAVIILISRASLNWPDFVREIDHSHRIGCPMLPLLIDISREEFEQLAPAWCRMLGSSPLVEFRRADPLSEMVERLVATASTLAISADETLVAPEDPAAPPYGGQIWATDANQIDILDLDRVLFRNATIDDFLNRKHRHFISATKGFGKTLLLTCKRQLLTQSSKTNSQPMTMVPEGRPYLDFMSEMRSLSAKYEKPLSDLSTTKRLWNMAFRVSAISHHPAIISPHEFSEIDVFPSRIQRWLKGAKIQPTVVFKELTTLRVSELNRLIDGTENFLDQKARQIHGGICFFVDKVDQAIRHLSREAWIAVQAGLIEAAWESMNANSHLKIYASIRQEAFSNYQSDIKGNLFSATTSLDYSEEELQALLDQLARCYEGCRSFADFLGLNVVRHGRRPAPEDSFQYVRRHTIGRPRDLVAMASEISSKRASMSERRLREIVQQTSCSVVIANLFDEVRAFLSCLDDRDARLRFFSEIPSNILTKTDAIAVCERFNGLAPGTLDHFGEDSSEIFHPFRDLWFAGLVGVTRLDQETGLIRQYFRRPHDSLTHEAAELPSSPVYLLHPALDTFIRALRTRNPFLQFQHIRVGENLVWQSYFQTLMQVERQLQRVEAVEFRNQAHHVVKRLQALLASGNRSLARVEIENSPEWRALSQQRANEACEDALFWLQELLAEC